MKKAESIVICIAGVALVVVYVCMAVAIAKEDKRKEERHSSRMNGYDNENEIYSLVKKGIESGELKVAIIASEGIQLEKEVKPKKKKKK